MPIVVQLDVMLARRKMRARELAERIGITEQNLSLLKSGKVRGMRFETLSRICTVLQCQPGDLLAHVPDGATAPGGGPDPGTASTADTVGTAGIAGGPPDGGAGGVA